MKMKLIWIVVMFVLTFSFGHHGCTNAPRPKPEVHEYLKRRNKPPVKSIKSREGNIRDCIDIFKQPAFDHPLLKNHTLKMRPMLFPKGMPNEHVADSNNMTRTITRPWRLNKRCPEGTIPIRRVMEKDLSRAPSLDMLGQKTTSHLIGSKVDTFSHEYATASADDEWYHGGGAKLYVWKPFAEEDDMSLAQMWISAGPLGERDIIEVGWHVLPRLYGGDDRPRFFTYWTADDYQNTGCYNLECPGFVQTSDIEAFGELVNPISEYDGEQHGFDVFVWKDEENYWWVKINEEILGYWPAKLFDVLSGGADVIQWGGEVAYRPNRTQHTTSQMGSGHFPEEGHKKAGAVTNLKVVNTSDQVIDPNSFVTYISSPACYDIALHHDDNWDNYFYYGGPGRNANCQ